jgi:hypothetical protein
MKPASKAKKPQAKYGVGHLLLSGADASDKYVLGYIKRVITDDPHSEETLYDIQWFDDYDNDGELYSEYDIDKWTHLLNLFMTDREACDKYEF